MLQCLHKILQEVKFMGQSTLSVRIDDDIKKSFDIFCSKVGLNPSVAVNMFVRAVLRENRIPFEVAADQDPFYSETNQRRLRKSIEQMERGENLIIKTMEELEAMANE
jgi:DNA-damage-inducible protein J